jgi:hypothetical protein
MAIAYRKAVGPGSPVLLADMVTLPGGPAVAIHHQGGGNVYIGDSTVTANTGFNIGSDGHVSFVIDGSESVYGITSTTTLTVQVFRTNSSSTPTHS